MNISGANLFWESDVDVERADRNEFIHRRPPGASIRQIHEMEKQMIFLTIEMAINEARPFNAEGNIVASDPPAQIGEKISVIGKIVPGEAAVQIGGKKSDAATGLDFAEDETRDFRLGLAHPNRFR